MMQRGTGDADQEGGDADRSRPSPVRRKSTKIRLPDALQGTPRHTAFTSAITAEAPSERCCPVTILVTGSNCSIMRITGYHKNETRSCPAAR